MPFGRVVLSTGQWTYEYHLKDHLGNTRVAFTPGTTVPTVVQKLDYYAFGKQHETGNLQNGNLFRYNGKEQYEDYGLGWYNYGARMYDPELGNWHAPDPLAGNTPGISPYAYCYNNPISFVDPDGMQVYPTGNTDFPLPIIVNCDYQQLENDRLEFYQNFPNGFIHYLPPINADCIDNTFYSSSTTNLSIRDLKSSESISEVSEENATSTGQSNNTSSAGGGDAGQQFDDAWNAAIPHTDNQTMAFGPGTWAGGMGALIDGMRAWAMAQYQHAINLKYQIAKIKEYATSFNNNVNKIAEAKRSMSGLSGVPNQAGLGSLGGSFVDGFLGGAEATWGFVKSQFTWEGYSQTMLNTFTLGTYSTFKTIYGIGGLVSNIPNYTANDYAYGAGFATEKGLEILLLKKVSGEFQSISGGFRMPRFDLRFQSHTHSINPISGRGISGSSPISHFNINKFHIIYNPKNWSGWSNNPHLPFRYKN